MPQSSPDAHRILAALPTPTLVVDGGEVIAYVNTAAEIMLGQSSASLLGQSLTRFLAADHPLLLLIDRARQRQSPVTDHGMTLSSPLIGHHVVSLNLAPLDEEGQAVVLSLTPLTHSQKFSDHWKQRSLARTMDGLVGMLGHEIKNPLAGIRGAAQLLQPAMTSDEDRELAGLIIAETERLAALVDSMEDFARPASLVPQAVNIHRVLHRVARLAVAGFAKGLEIEEAYDPSLPPVAGEENALVQIIMNLVKNAAEALQTQRRPEEGKIRLQSRYRHGLMMAAPGSEALTRLPLQVSIIDNGPGVPEALQASLFEPFVTDKATGRGLGLALVSKMVQDLGGVIEFSSQPGHTEFRLLLPEFDTANALGKALPSAPLAANRTEAEEQDA